MIKEFDEDKNINKEKVLVCITAQSNSTRLIDKGVEIADKIDGELHIIHVLKGNNVFKNPETMNLMQKLFIYGGGHGGVIHAFCNDNISGSIINFVKNEKITKIILGEPPNIPEKNKKSKKSENQFNLIIKGMPKNVEVIIVKREIIMDRLA